MSVVVELVSSGEDKETTTAVFGIDSDADSDSDPDPTAGDEERGITVLVDTIISVVSDTDDMADAPEFADSVGDEAAIDVAVAMISDMDCEIN